MDREIQRKRKNITLWNIKYEGPQGHGDGRKLLVSLNKQPTHCRDCQKSVSEWTCHFQFCWMYVRVKVRAMRETLFWLHFSSYSLSKVFLSITDRVRVRVWLPAARPAPYPHRRKHAGGFLDLRCWPFRSVCILLYLSFMKPLSAHFPGGGIPPLRRTKGYLQLLVTAATPPLLQGLCGLSHGWL